MAARPPGAAVLLEGLILLIIEAGTAPAVRFNNVLFVESGFAAGAAADSSDDGVVLPRCDDGGAQANSFEDDLGTLTLRCDEGGLHAGLLVESVSSVE